MKGKWCFIGLLLLAACSDNQSKDSDYNAWRERADGGVWMNTTPVVQQGANDLCWLHAMLSTIETERLEQGDSIHLSSDYLVCNYLTDRASSYFFTHKLNNLSLRGTLPMALELFEKYGTVEYDAYYSRMPVNYRVVCRRLKQSLSSAVSIRKARQNIKRVLEEQVGVMPQSCYIYGVEYTPHELAHSMVQKDDYTILTSFSHHPFWRECRLELADHQSDRAFFNVPIDTLMARMEESLLHHHPVAWEGDISESTFCWNMGFATMPGSDTLCAEPLQQLRQRLFEARLTTDDHCMALVGITRDKKTGKKLFIAKNSWGTENVGRGFIYLTENYVKLKTIAVGLRNRDFPRSLKDNE